jgi:two-component system chemotaxis response regulator CheB
MTASSMVPFRHVVVIGASADGVSALQRIAHDLPADFAAPVLVVLHVGHHSKLPAILSRSGQLPAVHPVDGERLRAGRIYVAPSDRDIRVERDAIRVGTNAVDHHCPSIDALFRSAAAAYGPAVIGVILTGYLDDGADGLRMIKESGGIAIVQDPHEASVPQMPLAAAARTAIDYTCTLAEIGPLLVWLVSAPETRPGADD